MRLWHKDLIDVLPDMQLRGQWRECCLIAKALHEGNLNHLLVNKVKEYPIDHFYTYCKTVSREMFNRGHKVTIVSSSKVYHQAWSYVEERALFDGWHTNRYLRQCLYNLQEKHDCGGIPDSEWERIVKKYPWIEEE